MAPLLRVTDLTKRFGGVAAVNRFSFDLHEGEILGLVGPNGAGKTTVFNLICGLVRPDGGRAVLQDRNLLGLRPHEVSRLGVARTFQVVRPFRRLTLLENAMVGPLARGVPIAAARREARANLETVGLGDRAGHLASSLTLADRKKLELARALGTRPRLLLLDEVMGGLNLTEAQEMTAVVRRIHAAGVSLVVIEHIMAVVLALCDRAIVLNHGEKLAEGPPQTVLRDPTVITAYIGEEPALA